MTDHDDDIARRYRETAREEPPAALDAAILAASRRAVGAGPRANRWAVPASIAAVLVLGIGVSLRMQQEQPGIESSPEVATSSVEYPMPQASDATSTPAAAPPAATTSQSAAIAEPKREAAPQPRIAAPARKAIKPADLPPEAISPAAPAPFSDRAPQLARSEASPPPAAAARSRSATTLSTPANVAPPPSPQAQELRAERAAGAADSKMAKAPRDAQLERIARLRAEGRHEEADKALEAFRREHPQYRIPDDVWERVKPR